MIEMGREYVELGIIMSVIVSIFAFGFIVVTLLDTDSRTMDVTLMNVSEDALPYRLYVNGELVQNGTILPDDTAQYQYVKPYGIWHPWQPHTVSVVTPNTVYEREVESGGDLCFVLD